MGVNIDISDIEKLADKLDNAEKNSEENILKTVKRLTLDIADTAKDLCVVDTGHLRENIFTRIMQENNELIGEVFCDVEYAVYVEFGTGRVGASYNLQREGVDLHYRMTPWLIPVTALSPEDAKTYGFEPIFENGKVKGYLCYGAKPHPFLYPAMKNNEDYIIEELGKCAMEII